jgi:hypothetical protein
MLIKKEKKRYNNKIKTETKGYRKGRGKSGKKCTFNLSLASASP